MEAYIDYMMVKALRTEYHLDHLRQAFDIQEKYKMILNPTKWTFEILAGKYLRYLVTQRGIKANQDHQSFDRYAFSEKKNDVQRLNGRVCGCFEQIHLMFLGQMQQIF